MSLITADNLNQFYKRAQSKSTFYIEFVGASEGDTYSIASGTEIITGEVPESLEVVQTVKQLNASYTVSVVHEEETYYTIVETGDFYGLYEVTLYTSILDNIQIRTSITKTAYRAGEFIDLTGLGVNAVYEDEEVLDVTSDCTFNLGPYRQLKSTDTALVVSYSESGVTKSVSINITVTDECASLDERVTEIESAGVVGSFTRPVVQFKTSTGADIETASGSKLDVVTLSQAEIASMLIGVVHV